MKMTVRTDRPGAKIKPAMWGIFFEDINLGADGGLYAELVKNCGFEFPDSMMGWFKLLPGKARGALSIRRVAPFPLVKRGDGIETSLRQCERRAR